MSKHSFEFKKQLVLEYLNGEGGAEYISNKHGLSDTMLRKWIAAYKTFGDHGLMRSRKNENYSFEKKLSTVELYLSSELSYQELAHQVRIKNPSLVAKWVNDFRLAGPDALRPLKKGRKKTLGKYKKDIAVQPVEEITVDTSAEHVKELEDELLKLRIENAFLKELRRLRLEDEAKMRERRESSTVSEESSN